MEAHSIVINRRVAHVILLPSSVKARFVQIVLTGKAAAKCGR